MLIVCCDYQIPDGYKVGGHDEDDEVVVLVSALPLPYLGGHNVVEDSEEGVLRRRNLIVLLLLLFRSIT